MSFTSCTLFDEYGICISNNLPKKPYYVNSFIQPISTNKFSSFVSYNGNETISLDLINQIKKRSEFWQNKNDFTNELKYCVNSYNYSLINNFLKASFQINFNNFIQGLIEQKPIRKEYLDTIDKKLESFKQEFLNNEFVMLFNESNNLNISYFNQMNNIFENIPKKFYSIGISEKQSELLNSKFKTLNQNKPSEIIEYIKETKYLQEEKTIEIYIIKKENNEMLNIKIDSGNNFKPLENFFKN